VPDVMRLLDIDYKNNRFHFSLITSVVKFSDVKSLIKKIAATLKWKKTGGAKFFREREDHLALPPNISTLRFFF
jgi:hypothetical protein